MPDVQQSGPLVGRPLTDTHWRALLGDEPAILADTDGSAYRLSTPTGTETAEVGSPTIDSVSRVAGFMHRIPAGQTQSIVIPPSTNAAVGRTDLIVVRYDPAVTEEPGPCRLHRIPGVEGSAAAPTPDTSAPGVEDLPLYAVTRKSGQSLTQAAVVDLRTRSGPSLLVRAGVSLPSSAPIGSRAWRGTGEYVREMVGSAPDWVPSAARGLRPHMMIGREVAFNTPIVSTEAPVYAAVSTVTRKVGDADTHMRAHLGASQLITPHMDTNPARIEVLTAGVYAVELRAQVVLAADDQFYLELNAVSGGGYLPVSRQHSPSGKRTEVTLAATRYYTAGRTISGKWGTYLGGAFTPQRFFISATRISD